MKKNYIVPKQIVISLDLESIIASSPGDGNIDGGANGEQPGDLVDE